MKINVRHAPVWKEGDMWLRLAVLTTALSGAMIAAGIAYGQTLLDVHDKAGVACTACHTEEPFAAPPNEVCVACHGTMVEKQDDQAESKPDPHLALQLGEGEIPPCTTCHTVHGSTD
jgi:hypothetical protein